MYGHEGSRLLSSGDSLLNEEGKFTVEAKLLPEKETDSILSTLEATVTGPSRRTVSGRIQTIVHRGLYYIGLKPETMFLQKGEELEVDFIAASPDGEILSGEKIHLSLLKREWHSVRKAGIGGRYTWQSEKVDKEIEKKQGETKDKPARFSFKPEKAGFYILKAEGEDKHGNPIITTTYLYVTGRDYIPWERTNEDIVELVLDKDVYHPGDKAKILVKSPYEKAKALVTVERESILDTEIIDIIGNSHQIELPIKTGYLPNVFVSVLLVQGRTSPKSAEKPEDFGKPSFKIGYQKISVDPSEKRLSLELKTDKEKYKPGEEVILEVKVTDSKKQGTKTNLSVAVVDLGVLSLIGFKTPDPFSVYYRHKPLSVQTSEIRQFVMEQIFFGEKGDEVGGGVGERMAAALSPSLSEIELRGNFQLTAYWNPSVETDTDGKARIRFNLPDNLTTFKIMVVGQTLESQFGNGETSFKVSKPLLLKPAFPRFARVGDEFKGGVVVHNYSASTGEVNVQCDVKGLILFDKSDIQKFSLKAGESKEVLYSFQVDNPGQAVLGFRAAMGTETDGLKITFPLELPRPKETVATHGETKESIIEKIKVPENAYPLETKLLLEASSSALTDLKGNVDFLSDYPYLCLEQLVSSVLPYIIAPDIIFEFGLTSMSLQDVKERVQKALMQIENYQKDSGGFGLWPDSPHPSPFNSCYAVFAMIKARQNDYKINPQVLDSASRYLLNLIRRKNAQQHSPYKVRTWKTTQAFVLYCLALLDQHNPSYTDKMYSERENLSLFGKTLLLKSMHLGKSPISAQTSLIQELMNKIKVTPTSAHFEDDEGREGGWIYSSNLRTTCLILQSLIEIGSDHSLIPSIARWIVESKKTRKWSSTQQNFYVFYALNEFLRKYEHEKPEFLMKASINKKPILEKVFDESRKAIVSTEISLSNYKPGKTINLNIKKEGPGTLYYQTRLNYAPKKSLAARDQGLTIYKEFLSPEGTPLETIKAGSLIAVKLQIIVPQESLYIVVEDPLPAGLEAVNASFLTESLEQQRKFRAISKPSRWWWQGFNHIELHDNKVLLFADSLAPGIHTHVYLARALTYGTFQAPGSKVEEMYSPEVFGRSAEVLMKITE